MTTGERVKAVRKYLNLTLDQFGSNIGLRKSTLSTIENNKSTLTDQVAISICREYHVNYDWLVHGDDTDMFEELPDTLFDELAAEFDVSDLEKKLLKAYLILDPKIRAAIIEHIKKELLEN